jgi:hypothetical protein
VASTNNCEAWIHYNAAGQRIASGERWGPGRGDITQRCHAPFPIPDDIFDYLKSADHMMRVTTEAIVRNMLQCLELEYEA